MNAYYSSLVITLQSDDIAATIRFYTEKLDFTVGNTMEEEGRIVWAVIAKDEIELMFCIPNAHFPYKPSTLTGDLYIKTNDVAAVWQKIKKDCEVVYLLEDFEYGMREFAIYDNNKYILRFGQALADTAP